MRAIILGLLLLWPAYVSADTARVALIVVDFADSESAYPQTMEWQRADADRVEGLYAEMSYGRTSLTIDTFGVFRVPLVSTSTWWGDVEREAQAAAISGGMDANAYTGFAYVFPIIPNHPAGIARGANVYIATWRGQVHPSGYRVLAHEIGHAQYGFTHARGPSGEYGDYLDVMGSGLGHVNNIKKAGRGWLDAEQMSTVTESGDYVLTPLHKVGGLKGIIISGGRKLSYSWVFEYRQPVGYESSYMATEGYNGALARITLNGGELIEFNPPVGQFAADKRPALMVGQQWCNKDARVSITTVSATQEALTLRVRFGNCR